MHASKILVYLFIKTKQIMKNQEVKSNKDINYLKAVAVLFPRQNGTPAGFAALQASLIRSQSLIK